MIFAVIVGTILALGGFEPPVALLILAGLLAARVVVDLRWDRWPIIGRVSPYVVYCNNLSRAGEPIEQAWISYAIQLFVFGALLGGAAYAVVRYFL